MDTSAATAALEGRYAALRAHAHELGTDELLDVVELAQREKDAASARQAVALAHLSARESHLGEDGTSTEVHHGLGHQRLDAPELAAARLGVSVHVAANRILTAIRQLTRTPAVVDAMASGDLDDYRASIITDETEFLDDQAAAEVTTRIKDHWKGLTPGPLRRFVARTAAQVDPDAVARQAQDERTRRGLTRRTGTHGTDHWRGDFRVEHARAAWDAVTVRARQLVRDGDADTLAQARADAMMELILEHCDIKVVVHTTRAAEPSNDNENDTDDSATADAATAEPATDGPGGGEPRRSAAQGSPTAAGASPQQPRPTPQARPVTPAGAHRPPERSRPPAPPNPPAHPRPRGEDLVEVGGMSAPGTTFVPRDWLDRADNPDDPADAPGAPATGQVRNAPATGRAGNPPATGRVGNANAARDLTCHPDTGALLAGDVPEALASSRTRPSRTRRAEHPTPAYRIPETMARLVRLRDGSCRFPGCSTPTRQCDLDHVRAWPTGPTSPDNLIALCRRHHRIKQRPGWHVRIHPDATVTWTDPTGREHTTWPVDHLHLVTAHAHTTALDTTADPTDPTDPAGPDCPNPGTAAIRRALELPTTFEAALHDLLETHAPTPRPTRPHVWDADGTLLSGPPPTVDLDTGHGPATPPGPRINVIVDYPPPPPPVPDTIPF